MEEGLETGRAGSRGRNFLNYKNNLKEKMGRAGWGPGRYCSEKTEMRRSCSVSEKTHILAVDLWFCWLSLSRLLHSEPCFTNTLV